jgi:transcriptional regulator with XRE-family HTH domain
VGFGPRQLKELRESLGINQRDLANALSVSQAYVSMVESGEKSNSEFLKKAEQYLREEVAPVRRSELPKTRGKVGAPSEPKIDSFKSGNIAWAWTAVSHESESGDVFDYAKIGEGSFAFLLADAVGHGVRASWQSAQIRFGFQAIAACLNQYSNTPAQFLGPLSRALKAVRIRRLAPPSVAIVCLSAKTGALETAAFGLPNPLHFSKKRGKLEPLQVESADRLRADVLPNRVVSGAEIEPGDTLFVFTDGFLSWLKETKGLNSTEAAALFMESAKFFSGKSVAMIKAILGASPAQGRAKIATSEKALDDATLFIITRRIDGWGE